MFEEKEWKYQKELEEQRKALDEKDRIIIIEELMRKLKDQHK